MGKASEDEYFMVLGNENIHAIDDDGNWHNLHKGTVIRRGDNNDMYILHSSFSDEGIVGKSRSLYKVLTPAMEGGSNPQATKDYIGCISFEDAKKVKSAERKFSDGYDESDEKIQEKFYGMMDVYNAIIDKCIEFPHTLHSVHKEYESTTHESNNAKKIWETMTKGSQVSSQKQQQADYGYGMI